MTDETPTPNVRRIALARGQALLLCTDGLWNYFKSGELASVFAQLSKDQLPALDICRELVRIANERGGRDNITVALFLS